MALFLMIFSRPDLRIGVSRAKNCEESDSDVHFCVAPPKPAKKAEKQKFLTENKIAKKNVRRRKIKRWESSETRFGKVWRPYELCLRGKRPFKV